MNMIRTVSVIGALIASPVALGGSIPLSDSGLVTLIPGQTAQLNVVNIDPTIGSSCKVTLSLLDSTSSLVAPPLDSTIFAGTSAQPLQFIAGTPVSLRAHIDYSPQLISNFDQKDPMAGCYNLLPTLEVIDNTGTRVILSDFVGIPNVSEKAMKIDVCHNASKHNPHTINVAISAWKAHKGHGDTLGPCP